MNKRMKNLTKHSEKNILYFFLTDYGAHMR